LREKKRKKEKKKKKPAKNLERTSSRKLLSTSHATRPTQSSYFSLLENT